ncbi:MAG: hypothetical protein QOF65_708, partial [Thermoleophilaceae bacterium]|nr:hypothetical protein [Thermoleophilaceae bacterium]
MATKTASRRNGSNGTGNAQKFARQSRAKMDRKREQAEGASAWVAERAGDWDLDAQDMQFMERQK